MTTVVRVTLITLLSTLALTAIIYGASQIDDPEVRFICDSSHTETHYYPCTTSDSRGNTMITMCTSYETICDFGHNEHCQEFVHGRHSWNKSTKYCLAYERY